MMMILFRLLSFSLFRRYAAASADAIFADDAFFDFACCRCHVCCSLRHLITLLPLSCHYATLITLSPLIFDLSSRRCRCRHTLRHLSISFFMLDDIAIRCCCHTPATPLLRHYAAMILCLITPLPLTPCYAMPAMPLLPLMPMPPTPCHGMMLRYDDISPPLMLRIRLRRSLLH